MALQSSGQITLKEIAAEFEDTAPSTLKEFYGAATGVPSRSCRAGTVQELGIHTDLKCPGDQLSDVVTEPGPRLLAHDDAEPLVLGEVLGR